MGAGRQMKDFRYYLCRDRMVIGLAASESAQPSGRTLQIRTGIAVET
jgi:hypothetical protein